ncbi:hypothetical protein PENTCL1PPCAC_584, partial [Pristionchus entomophagus]
DNLSAVPFPFSADPPPRSSPRASLESSDESRASSSSSDLAVSTPDFATPPQSPITVVKRAPKRDDDVSEKTGEKEDNVGIRSDPADSLQMPPAPLPAHLPEKMKETKKDKVNSGLSILHTHQNDERVCRLERVRNQSGNISQYRTPPFD